LGRNRDPSTWFFFASEEEQALRMAISLNVMQASEISEFIRQAAREAGFELSGVAQLSDHPELARFPEWIGAGHAGDMKYLESRDDSGQLKRSSPADTFPWARSVVVCAINYNTSPQYSIKDHKSHYGWISRYAWGKEDYHDAVMRRLQVVEDALRATTPEIITRCYVDTGPIVERVYAKYAGIGWIGKNTCILNQQLGSWLFLGVILTSLELAHDLPAADRCGTCTRCIDACPTNAFVGPYELDATRCISYLTIEKRGSMPEDLRERMGRHVFGCDICQDVCPWNRKSPVTSAPEFQAREGLVNPALDWLANISEEEFRERFRGSAVKRAKRRGIRRNAVTAMGNSGDQEFVPTLENLKADHDITVAESAKWALARLQKS
jgi:epoxyqueuosine reductase